MREGLTDFEAVRDLSKFEVLIFEQGNEVGMSHGRGFPFLRITSREELMDSRASAIQLSSAVISLKWLKRVEICWSSIFGFFTF